MAAEAGDLVVHLMAEAAGFGDEGGAAQPAGEEDDGEQGEEDRAEREAGGDADDAAEAFGGAAQNGGDQDGGEDEEDDVGQRLEQEGHHDEGRDRDEDAAKAFYGGGAAVGGELGEVVRHRGSLHGAGRKGPGALPLDPAGGKCPQTRTLIVMGSGDSGPSGVQGRALAFFFRIWRGRRRSRPAPG